MNLATRIHSPVSFFFTTEHSGFQNYSKWKLNLHSCCFSCRDSKENFPNLKMNYLLRCLLFSNYLLYDKRNRLLLFSKWLNLTEVWFLSIMFHALFTIDFHFFFKYFIIYIIDYFTLKHSLTLLISIIIR